MKLTPQEKRKHLSGAPGHIIDMVEEKLILWANGYTRISRSAARPDEVLAVAIAVEIEAARNRALPTEATPKKPSSKAKQPRTRRRSS